MVSWYNATVIRIDIAAPAVRRFWLQLPAETAFEFQAGQFVTFDLPIAEKRLGRWRSYSIANHPDHTRVLEFCIVHNPQGPGTSYLFDQIEEGSVIRFKGPDGTFVLPQVIDTDLVMICTGTGIAPFRSMLWDIYFTMKPYRHIHLIFGTRREENILYREELVELKKNLPRFSYDVVLSREPSWSGWRGYVHQVYQQSYGQRRDDVRFMLCGWTQMIDEAVAHLVAEMGYDRRQVIYELYG